MNKLIYESIDSTFIRLVEPFVFESSLIGRIEVPVDFVCDRESVPLLRGTSERGGIVHDYLCRKNSIPVVIKEIAAKVYLEVMAFRRNPWWKRYVKYWVVRVAWGYFHKFTVEATYEELSGNKE